MAHQRVRAGGPGWRRSPVRRSLRATARRTAERNRPRQRSAGGAPAASCSRDRTRPRLRTKSYPAHLQRRLTVFEPGSSPASDLHHSIAGQSRAQIGRAQVRWKNDAHLPSKLRHDVDGGGDGLTEGEVHRWTCDSGWRHREVPDARGIPAADPTDRPAPFGLVAVPRCYPAEATEAIRAGNLCQE